MAGGEAAARKTARAFRAYIDLLEAADWIRAYMTSQLNTFDLNMSEFRLLELLHRYGPMYREAIADRWQCTPHAVGRAIQGPKERGLIQGEEGWLAPVAGREKTSESGDEGRRGKRIVLLSLTTEGKKTIAHVFPKHAKVVKALMRALDAREQETLSRVCRKLQQGDVVKFVREIRRRDEDRGIGEV